MFPRTAEYVNHEEKMSMNWLNSDLWRAHVSWLSPPWVAETEEARRDFDAARWMDQIESAHYRSLIFYIKHHDGFCAYPSKYLKEPPERDYFGECVTEAHKRGMLIQAYYSSVLDQITAEEHPDWRVVGKDGLPQEGWYSPFWPNAHCCINNPGYRGLVLGQITELRDNYHPDGFWLDVFSPVPCATGINCFCHYCQEKYHQETGGNLLEAPDDLLAAHISAGVIEQPAHWYLSCFGPFMKEIRDIVKADNPNCTLGQNTGIRIPEVDAYCDFLTHEAATSPTISQMCRSLRSCDKPFETTYRLYSAVGSWAMRGRDRVLLESMTTAAHGGACSIELSPTNTGKIMEEAVQRVADVGAYIRQKEKYLLNTKPVYDAALFQPITAHGWPRPAGWHTVLAERDIPYAILYPDADLAPYRLLILDDTIVPDEMLAMRISEFVKAGGSLIVEAGCAAWGTPAGDILSDVLGISSPGVTGRPVHYLSAIDERATDGLGEDDLIVEGDAYLIEPSTAEVLAYYRHEFAERKPGRQRLINLPPARSRTNDPAITVNRWGKGRAMYIGCPLAITEIREHRTKWDDAREYPIQLAANLTRFMITDPLLKGTTPAGIEVIVNSQGQRFIVHLLNQYTCGQYYDNRTGILHLADVPICVNENRIGRVTKAFHITDTGECELPVNRESEWAKVEMPRVGVHEMIGFEVDNKRP